MSLGRDELQILIIGRTIEGLALAGFLRQADFEPIVLATPHRQSRRPVCTLPPVTIELFEQLGVADYLCEFGWPIRHWTVHRPAGDETHHIPAGEPAPVVVPRSVIRDRLQRTIPDASIRTGSRVDSLSTNDDYARIGLADGIEESFDLIVGADGARSVVRAQLTTCRVNEHDRDILSIAATTERSEIGITEFHHTDAHVISVDTGETTRINACSPSIDTTSTEAAVDSLPSCVLPAQSGDLTVQSRDRIQSPSHTEQAWLAGRGVLLGSAAAAVPPLAGIGLPLAIGDAKVFAQTLVAGSDSIDAKLQAYARERQAVRDGIDNHLHECQDTPHRRQQPTHHNLVASRELFRTVCLERPGLLAV